MEKEILAPVGSYESLLAAVQNGCNAIYVGGMRFGARAFANNFSDDQLVKAIEYCHLYGVAVYVTVNTLVYENEKEEALSYIDFLYQHQVDAIIVQDYGILHEVRRRYPNFMVHASTQMHVHNIEGVKLLASLGVTRTVLSRECSIHQIKEIHQACPDMELEIFVYGAHCVSYSGQCLLSGMIGGRSGNRGECAQPCRLSYELIKDSKGRMVKVKDNQYLLSMKDLNTIEHIHALIDAGVTSFKIEGRMKRPEYVAKVVSIFQKTFQAYDNGQPFVLSAQDNQDLLKLFNRGFTPGHIFDQRGSDIVNFHRPNHIGIPLGEVVYVHNKEKRIGIRLKETLYQGDGIRFITNEDDGWIINKIYKNDLLVNQGNQGDTIEIDLRHGIRVGDVVVKTSDSKLLEQLRQTFLIPSRKIPIDIKITIGVGKPMTCSMKDEMHRVHVSSSQAIEQATNNSITSERIVQQMSKLGDTPFVVRDIVVDNDNASMVPISQLNQLRRDAVALLIEKREKRQSLSATPREILNDPNQIEITSRCIAGSENPKVVELRCSVYTEDQLQAARACGIKKIYVHAPELYEAQMNQAKDGIEHQPESNHDLIFSSKRVNENQCSYPGDALLVRELGALYHAIAHNQAIHIDDVMNVTNASSIQFFTSFGANSITLSNELSLIQIKQMLRSGYAGDVEMNVYGRVETMLMKYCAINTCTVDTKEKDCNMCRIGEQYYLSDRKGEQYPILTDRDCFSHLLHSKPTLMLEQVHDIVASGVNVLRMNFTVESYHECEEIIVAFQQTLIGKPYYLSLANTTTGYYSNQSKEAL